MLETKVYEHTKNKKKIIKIDLKIETCFNQCSRECCISLKLDFPLIL